MASRNPHFKPKHHVQAQLEPSVLASVQQARACTAIQRDAKLELVPCFGCSKPNQGAASKAWKAPSWFPATTVPDILTRRSWSTLHVMSLEQSKALKEAFETAADANGYISWLKCMQIAKDLGLEYEQVRLARFNYHKQPCACVSECVSECVCHHEPVLLHSRVTLPGTAMPCCQCCSDDRFQIVWGELHLSLSAKGSLFSSCSEMTDCSIWCMPAQLPCMQTLPPLLKQSSIHVTSGECTILHPQGQAGEAGPCVQEAGQSARTHI